MIESFIENKSRGNFLERSKQKVGIFIGTKNILNHFKNTLKFLKFYLISIYESEINEFIRMCKSFDS